jgi:hypothetical protein
MKNRFKIGLSVKKNITKRFVSRVRKKVERF